MTAELPSTWASRELPILRAALRHMDAGEQTVDLRTICDETGLDMPQVITGTMALEAASPPYLAADYVKTAQTGAIRGWINAVGERARREFGTWPTPESLVDRLAAALEDAANAEQEPQRKGKARAAADAIGGFLRDVAVQAIGTQIGGAGPL